MGLNIQGIHDIAPFNTSSWFVVNAGGNAFQTIFSTEIFRSLPGTVNRQPSAVTSNSLKWITQTTAESSPHCFRSLCLRRCGGYFSIVPKDLFSFRFFRAIFWSQSRFMEKDTSLQDISCCIIFGATLSLQASYPHRCCYCCTSAVFWRWGWETDSEATFAKNPCSFNLNNLNIGSWWLFSHFKSSTSFGSSTKLWQINMMKPLNLAYHG